MQWIVRIVVCVRLGRSAGGRVTNVTELKPSNFTS